MKKRMLAMLLTVCMVLSILPAAAFAANTALPFTDVKAGQWFYDDVAYVYEKDMMKGMSDTTFEPNTTTSRGMIVTILHRLEGTPVAKTAGTFTDVAKNQWYADAVDWAAESQIVNGYGNGKFGPGDTITRQQMAAILYRYADYKGYDVSKTNALDKYTDAGKIDSYARTAMEWANAQGLITGETATTLNPTGGATRAQAAAILRRFCEKVAGSGEKPEKPAEPVGPAPSTPTTPSSGNKHQVSFLLNDGSDGIFATQEVFTNKKAADPGIPERNLYGFTGWFTDSETTNSFDFSTPITEDLVLYAGWGAPDGSDSLYVTE